VNTSQEIAWKEHLFNDLFYVQWDMRVYQLMPVDCMQLSNAQSTIVPHTVDGCLSK